jgi:iron complex transport system ATP-binding protein
VSAVISVERAAFSYGTEAVFEDVTFDVCSGEALCLLGPNGSGKTTLLQCLLGIQRPRAGQIRVGGADIRGLSAREIARSVAYVPQRHDTVFPYTVLDIVKMGRAPYISLFGGPSASDARLAEEALQQTGIAHLRDRPCTRISGGEGQLVLLARALVQGTPVIVMDEPTAHLDFRNELMLLETIARLVREREVALVMATHNPNHPFHLQGKGVPARAALLHRARLHGPREPREVLDERHIREAYGVKASVVCFEQGELAGLSQVIPVGTADREED